MRSGSGMKLVEHIIESHVNLIIGDDRMIYASGSSLQRRCKTALSEKRSVVISVASRCPKSFWSSLLVVRSFSYALTNAS